MNNRQFTYLFVSIFLLFLSASAQVNRPRIEIGAQLSGFVYQGDLTTRQYGSFETTRPGFTLFGVYLFSSSFSFRGNFSMGSLKGDDALYKLPVYRRFRNFYFTTPVKELSLLFLWSPLADNYALRRISPYVFAGGGISFLHINRNWSRFVGSHFTEEPELIERLAEDQLQTPPGSLPVVPIGVGLKYRLTDKIALNAESSYRLLFNDYLDGFSKAANPDKNDHYHTLSAGVSYRIGKKDLLGCPVIKY